MITYQVTIDRNVIDRVLTDKAVWNKVTDDVSRNVKGASSYGLHIAAYRGLELLGLFIVQDLTSTCAVIHTAFLPSAWGESATQAAQGIFPWLFENYKVLTKVVGFVPTDNPLAHRFARLGGMRQEGLLKGAFTRNGVAHDMIIMGIGR